MSSASTKLSGNNSGLRRKPIVVETVCMQREVFNENEQGATVGQHIDRMIAEVDHCGGRMQSVTVRLEPTEQELADIYDAANRPRVS